VEAVLFPSILALGGIMKNDSKFISRETIDGESIVDGELTITPVSRVFAVRLPYINFIWNRPHIVRVEKGDDVEEIPVVNVTRMAQLAVYGFGVFIMAIVLLIDRITSQDVAAQ
jgi:hypothetical protein